MTGWVEFRLGRVKETARASCVVNARIHDFGEKDRDRALPEEHLESGRFPDVKFTLRLLHEAFCRIHPAMFGPVLVMRLFRDRGIFSQINGNHSRVLKASPAHTVSSVRPRIPCNSPPDALSFQHHAFRPQSPTEDAGGLAAQESSDNQRPRVPAELYYGFPGSGAVGKGRQGV